MAAYHKFKILSIVSTVSTFVGALALMGCTQAPMTGGGVTGANNSSSSTTGVNSTPTPGPTTTTTPTPTPTPTPAQGNAGSDPSALQGTWISSYCNFVRYDGVTPIYFDETIAISGNTLQVRTRYYHGANCPGTPFADITSQGQFEIRASGATSGTIDYAIANSGGTVTVYSVYSLMIGNIYFGKRPYSGDAYGGEVPFIERADQAGATDGTTPQTRASQTNFTEPYHQ